MTTIAVTRPSARNKVGFVLAGLFGLVDLMGPGVAPLAVAIVISEYQERNDPSNASMAAMGAAAITVLIVAVSLGLATIAGVVVAWSKGSRIAARVVAAARVMSALLIAPIFLVAGGLVPESAWIIVIAAAVVIADITAAILVLSRSAPGRS